MLRKWKQLGWGERGKGRLLSLYRGFLYRDDTLRPEFFPMNPISPSALESFLSGDSTASMLIHCDPLHNSVCLLPFLPSFLLPLLLYGWCLCCIPWRHNSCKGERNWRRPWLCLLPLKLFQHDINQKALEPGTKAGQRQEREKAPGPSNLVQIQKSKPSMNSDKNSELLGMGGGKMMSKVLLRIASLRGLPWSKNVMMGQN